MSRQILVSTTGTPATVQFTDLGAFILAHPTVGFDMLEPTTGGGFTVEDVMYSADFKAAIDTAAIIVTDENGFIVTDPMSEFSSDVKVKISAADTNPGFLEDKLTATANKLVLTKTGTGANEKINLSIGSNVFDKSVDDSDDVPTGASNKFLSANEKLSLGAVPTPLDGTNRVLALSDRGATNGVASLVSGKVPTSQLPDSVLGQVEYISAWNANTNSPTIPAADPANKGHYYVVSVAGSTNINGITSWSLGDWIISNGTAWEKVDNSDAVTSVAGKVGAVLLVAADISDFDTEVSNNTDVAANTTHRGRIDNPHNVTAAQVGNTVAQWNANKLNGVDVDPAAPTNKDILQFDSVSGDWLHLDPDVALAHHRDIVLGGGRAGNQNNGYLRNSDGEMFFNEAQFVVPFNATIIAITANCQTAVNEWRAEVRKALNPVFITSLVVLSSETSKVSGVLSVNVNQGELLSLYLQKGTGGSGSGSNIPNPSVRVYLVRR
jgi:hypothetical protein